MFVKKWVGMKDIQWFSSKNSTAYLLYGIHNYEIDMPHVLEEPAF